MTTFLSACSVAELHAGRYVIRMWHQIAVERCGDLLATTCSEEFKIMKVVISLILSAF